MASLNVLRALTAALLLTLLCVESLPVLDADRTNRAKSTLTDSTLNYLRSGATGGVGSDSTGVFGGPFGVVPVALRTAHGASRQRVLEAPAAHSSNTRSSVRLKWILDEVSLQQGDGQGPVRFEDVGGAPEARVYALRDVLQSHYEVQILRERAQNGAEGGRGDVVWSSGRVAGRRTVAYAPASALQPMQSYAWRVRVWLTAATRARSGSVDHDSNATEWSDALPFETAPSEDVWANASWVGGANELRTNVAAPAGLVKATAYVSGVGAFYFWVNGGQVDAESFMHPPQTTYHQHVQFVTFDVTDAMVAGKDNVLAFRIGNVKWGYLDQWCNLTASGVDGCRALRFAVVLTSSDGSTQTIGSTPSHVLVRQGPIVYDHLYHGEQFDNRLTVAGWNSAVTAPASGDWRQAVEMETSSLVGGMVPALVYPNRQWKQYTAETVLLMPPTCDTPSQLGGSVTNGDFLVLSCQPGSGTISNISFASYGHPTGACPNFAADPKCDATGVLEYVTSQCVGKVSCGIDVSKAVLGTPCADNPQTFSLAVTATGCTPSDSYVVDFGQNMNGNTKLVVQGPRGTEVRMKFSEILYGVGGTPYNTYWPCHQFENGIGFNCANQTDTFTLAGTGAPEEYTQAFTVHGFRYVQLWGLPSPADSTTLTARFVSNDFAQTGSVAMPNMEGLVNGTNDVLNRIQHITAYAQRSQAFGGILTDCPQRERRGWMGDAQMSSNEASLNYDMHAQHIAFIDNIRDEQLMGCEEHNVAHGCTNVSLAVGSVPDVSPYTGVGSFPGSPVWASAYVVIARHIYRNYGDMQPLVDHYAGLQALMDYFYRVRDPATGLVTIGRLGDWDPPPSDDDTPASAMGAFYYLLDLSYMTDIAALLGKKSDAQRYSDLYQSGLKAWHSGFYNATVGGYCNGTQTCNVCALYLGIPPTPAIAERTKESLKASIVTKHGNHSVMGIIGATFAFDVLRDIGMGSTALDVLLTDDFPSYGNMVNLGATTMWENFAGTRFTAQGSRNHIMFGGGVGTFTFKALAGLDTVSNATSTAFEHILVRPMAAALPRLGSASANLTTQQGAVSCSWQYSAKTQTLTLTTSLPHGTTGTVQLPLLGDNAVSATVTDMGETTWKAGKFVPGAPGVVSGSFADVEGVPAVSFEVGSGSYTFVATVPLSSN